MLKTKFIAGRILVVLALLAFVACGSSDNESASEAGDEQLATTDQETEVTGSPETDKPVDQPIEAEEITPAAEPKAEVKPKAEAKPKPKPPAETKKEEPAPEPEMVTIPTGTALAVALNTKLRTDSNAVGDPVIATLASAIMADGKTAIPAGSKLHGRVTALAEPGRTKGKAQMTLQFDKVATPDGRRFAITTAPLSFEAEGDKISDEAKIGGGGAIGGAIGALTSKKKGKGAIIGAAIGAAAGGAVALATKGKQIELPPGQQLSVEVTEATAVEVPKQ